MTRFKLFVAVALCLASVDSFATITARYAALNYDVVYVSCPRSDVDHMIPDPANPANTIHNWHGANDVWPDATNNVYTQPGCDLVLHHSAHSYGGNLPIGDPGREEVLVNCDETNTTVPVCTVIDPQVSLDGTKIAYAKWLDTRTMMSSEGILGGGRYNEGAIPNQSWLILTGSTIRAQGGARKPYASNELIFEYDLNTHTSRQVSPDTQFIGGHAHPGRAQDGTANEFVTSASVGVPVMDNSPVYLADGRICFISNRYSGFYAMQMMVMDTDGRNLHVLSHRNMTIQLHPFILSDGRITYSMSDTILQKSSNNQVSLYSINPDGSFPFIVAGKHDSTLHTYHYGTQLSDGSIIESVYYSHNNRALGGLIRFPYKPPGPQFAHYDAVDGIIDVGAPITTMATWQKGNGLFPFGRPGQYALTPNALYGDGVEPQRPSSREGPMPGYIHPADGRLELHGARFTHPSSAPENGLLTTVCQGGCSTDGVNGTDVSTVDSPISIVIQDLGVWYCPLRPNSTERIIDISIDCQIVVDSRNHHELMPRAVVPYSRIYGIPTPYKDVHIQLPAGNYSNQTRDLRIPEGAPFGLTGAASLYDRQTRSLNGSPWNASDGGGNNSGRTYLNLVASGAELGVFNNSQIYGIRVLMGIPQLPNSFAGKTSTPTTGREFFVDYQYHHLRILGEFPVRKADGTLLDGQGNPDTSFIVRIPADTPFFFQTLDKRGMALDIENSPRTVVRGEQQLCGGCHVHTRLGQNALASYAKRNSKLFGDFTGLTTNGAPLFDDNDGSGNPIVSGSHDIYPAENGVNSRFSFGADFVNNIAPIFQSRCSSCHGQNQPAQTLTGLRLDNTIQTYQGLINNTYKEGTTTYGPGYGRFEVINQCCIASRWVGTNSAISSMLVWALYGERLDGRDPANGQPYPESGVLQDSNGYDHPSIWAASSISAHLANIVGMPESEKRMIARWIDIGAPLNNNHDDMVRPILTLLPKGTPNQLTSVKVGVWDDSALDYTTFKITHNGTLMTTGYSISGTPSVITVTLPTPVNTANQDSEEYTFEIKDNPVRTWSLASPTVAATNHAVVKVTGRELFRLYKTGQPAD